MKLEYFWFTMRTDLSTSDISVAHVLEVWQYSAADMPHHKHADTKAASNEATSNQDKTSQGPETSATKVCGIITAGLRTPYCQTLSGTSICSQISCQLIRYTECEGKREAKKSDENDCCYSDPT
jgi:hypothetical protein